LCDPHFLNVSGIPGTSCSTSKVLVAFSWLCFGSVFFYYITLTLGAIMHQKEDCRVWHSGVRQFPWFALREPLRSAPATPIKQMFQRKAPSLFAPKARRPPPIFIQERAGINPKYEIEHFQDPSSVLERPALLPAAPPPAMQNAMSFYPTHVQNSMRTVLPQASVFSSAHRGPTPPPIRNWPRPMQETGSQPLGRAMTKGKGKAPARQPSMTEERPTPPRAIPYNLPAAPPSPSRTRPTGPRTRTSSGTNPRSRPPPLQLAVPEVRSHSSVRR